MKNFYIITNEIKDKGYVVTLKVKQLIKDLGGEAFLSKDLPEEGIRDMDCIITLGGDGTLIRTANKFFNYQIPLIGINLGNLGYLTEIEKHNIKEGLDALIKGEYHLESRMMLVGNIDKSNLVALNDIVITCKNRPSIISFDVRINGKFLHSYKADGVIISTPTGSTGYNMSAGGPIVDPSASLLLLTPICAHTLHGRSIVLSSTDKIEIILNQKHQGLKEVACVAYDGDPIMELDYGQALVIQQSSQSIDLLKLNKGSFLETLSRKMEG